jgi:hypothetical protein
VRQQLEALETREGSLSAELLTMRALYGWALERLEEDPTGGITVGEGKVIKMLPWVRIVRDTAEQIRALENTAHQIREPDDSEEAKVRAALLVFMDELRGDSPAPAASKEVAE